MAISKSPVLTFFKNSRWWLLIICIFLLLYVFATPLRLYLPNADERYVERWVLFGAALAFAAFVEIALFVVLLETASKAKFFLITCCICGVGVVCAYALFFLGYTTLLDRESVKRLSVSHELGGYRYSVYVYYQGAFGEAEYGIFREKDLLPSLRYSKLLCFSKSVPYAYDVDGTIHVSCLNSGPVQ